MHKLIEASWWKPRGLLSLVLMPLALFYAAVTALRRALYRFNIFSTYHAPVPVIVIGNFTVGGTGKTPVVIALVKALQAAGYIPGIVARGYGRNNIRKLIITNNSIASEAGDEPLLIKHATGAEVAVAAKRADAVKLLSPEVNVIVSDDGLQHLALARDMEIAVTDSRREGNGLLLPAGPLREQPRAVDAVLVTSGTVRDGEWAVTHRLGDAHKASDANMTQTLISFRGKRLAAVAGIGMPERFFEALRQRGIKLSQTLALPDHYDYAQNPFTEIQADAIFITAKDAIKCAEMDERLWVVPLQAELPDAFEQQVLTRLDQLRKT